MFHRKSFIKPIWLTSAYTRLFLIVIAATIALAGCGDDTTGPELNGDDNDDDPDSNVVQMIGQSFSPANFEVEVGTTVQWDNNSSETHTVTSGSNREHDGDFDSGSIAPGESFSHTFGETGTFDYFCVPHPGMEGSIIVVESE